MFSKRVTRAAEQAHSGFMKAVAIALFFLILLGAICMNNRPAHAHVAFKALPERHVSFKDAWDAVDGKAQHMSNRQAAQAVLYIFAEE